MQTNIDPDISKKITEDTKKKIDASPREDQLQLAAVASIKLALMVENPSEDRSLQGDIAREAISLCKAATMLKIVDMVKDAVIDACHDESQTGLRRLQNLVELYKERYPEIEGRLAREAEEKWKETHGNG